MSKVIKSVLFTISVITLITACGRNGKADDPIGESGKTVRTENMLSNLRAQADSGVYMFGHHDDVVYGIGWESDYDNDSTIGTKSDVKSVCNDFPAVLSFDLGHIELGDDKNLDGVPFKRIRQEIINHFDHGGMITLSWHLNNPLSGGTSWVADSLKDVEKNTVASVLEGGKQHELFLTWLDKVADFLNSLETPYGVRVPVLFRPWHEHTGSWFWWGQDFCTPEQYKSLWTMTVERLKDKGVVNALFAYSPGTEPDGDDTKYLERYPGDDIIDVVGLDCYCFAPDADTVKVAKFADDLDKNLAMVGKVAKAHNKVMALTETGYEGIKTSDWWTKTLAPVLAKYPIAYVLVWRNARERPQHHFAPYPGHASTANFVEFYNLKETLFLHDVNGLYLSNNN
jgi:mannan endo-1,4-beta-mannosidase